MKTNAYRKHNSGPISKAQINVIMIICDQFGISKADRAELLQERYKKSSTADLTSDQAGHFIKEFEQKGFVLKAKNGIAPRPRTSRRPEIPRNTGNVVALVSRDEMDKIAAVAALIQWRVENGLQLFLEKRMGIKTGTVRTSKEAYKAIEGLKKMFEHQMEANCGRAWWRMKFEKTGIMEYIEIHCPEEWK